MQDNIPASGRNSSYAPIILESKHMLVWHLVEIYQSTHTVIVTYCDDVLQSNAHQTVVVDVLH